MESIKINGRSGCRLEIINERHTRIVKKTSSNRTYNNRLIKQAEKQQSLGAMNRFRNNFIVPKILDSGFNSDSLYFFDMEYINAHKFSDYFSRITVIELNRISDILINYFENAFLDSVYKSPPNDIIIDKLNQLSEILNNNNYFDNSFIIKALYYLKSNIPNYKIPILECHGDLTFSNMLFDDYGNIHVFDFLDSFIESPIIDLIKIRQDTSLYWSIMIDNNLEDYKITRVLQVLNYLDSKFVKYLNSMEKPINQWYKYLEIFNLFRIVPYVHNEMEVSFLNNNINKLIYTK